jgi:hypothetical protein
MKKSTNNGLIGAGLIGLGFGLTAVGIALVIPACTNWSLGLVDQVMKKSKDSLSSGVESAANLAGQIHGTARKRFEEASQTARGRAVKAAEAVENAARQFREYAS